LGNDFETNRRYLAFSWWLLHRGWKKLMEEVQAAVVEVFGSLNPRDDISFEKLSELTLQVRKKIEGDTEEDRKYAPPCCSMFLLLWLLLTDHDQDTENGWLICFRLEKKKMMYWRSPVSSESRNLQLLKRLRLCGIS
jgi:hypothetical protein